MMENKEQMNSVRKHADRYKMINKWAEMTKEETEISSWGCFASCCWRFATGSQGQI